VSKKIRSFAAQAAALAPSSLAFGNKKHPFVGIDEGLNAKQVWDAVGGLVGAGLASGAGSLWHEVYRNQDGSIDPLRSDLDFDRATRIQRADRKLRRLPCTDSDVTSSVLAHLHLYRHVVVFSADLGDQHDALRTLLAKHVGPELSKEPRVLGVTLLLKDGGTDLAQYVDRILALFRSSDFQPGFREIVV
jgi:hypothetical protein